MESEESSQAAGMRITALYLGYGSNLSPKTMKQRCPDCLYAGMARLDDWKWIINETGYANIIPSPGDVVYGGLFFLSNRDETALDHSEGVPWLYEKRNVQVTRISQESEQKVEVTTYVDVQRTEEGSIEEDYIVWIKRAIQAALDEGVPSSYIDKYLKPFVREGFRDDQEINMIRTHMKIGEGSLLEQEMERKNLKLGPGWMFGGGGTGRVRDGSTS